MMRSEAMWSEMMLLGRGIGIVGIWVAVGFIVWHEPAAGVFASLPASFATYAIWTK